MTRHSENARIKHSIKLILLAGFCGGMAEVLWIAGYGSVAAVNATEVARQVTASVYPVAADMTWAPLLGVVIHLLLSLLLALVFARLVWPAVSERAGNGGALMSAVVALTAVWACNFFLVLPQLNPGFLDLMPLAVTLISKLLFGIAMAMVLQTAARKNDRKISAVIAA